MEQWQIDNLRRIAKLIGGDWSGTSFDGRDIKKWINKTLDGEDLINILTIMENRNG